MARGRSDVAIELESSVRSTSEAASLTRFLKSLIARGPTRGDVAIQLKFQMPRPAERDSQ
jgi:hypothetical protein